MHSNENNNNKMMGAGDSSNPKHHLSKDTLQEQKDYEKTL